MACFTRAEVVQKGNDLFNFIPTGGEMHGAGPGSGLLGDGPHHHTDPNSRPPHAHHWNEQQGLDFHKVEFCSPIVLNLN